jgi:hypothetical protein
MRLPIPILALVASLALHPAFAPGQEPQDDPAVAPPSAAGLQDMQARAFNLWSVGEFERAREVFECMAAGDPGEVRSRTALFHLGNLIESHLMMDAESPQQARDFLIEARQAYQRALARIGDSLPHAADQTRGNLERVERKLEALEPVLAGELDPVEAANTLNGMDASLAAAAHIEPLLNLQTYDSDRYAFLYLVYRVQHLDHACLRVVRAAEAVVQPDNDLVDPPALAARIASVDEAARSLEAFADSAVSRFSGSRHLLDLHVHTGDIHRYHGILWWIRARLIDHGIDFGDDDPAAVRAGARAHFERFAAEARKVDEFCERALTDPASLTPAQKDFYRPSTLANYRHLAAESLAAADQLLAGLDTPAGDAPAESSEP